MAVAGAPARGHRGARAALAPRLAVYPEFASTGRWLDDGMRFPVLDRSDAEGLGRDDPGAVLPQRFEDVANAGDGAEVQLVGRRSTAWYSGADAQPIELPLPAAPRGAVAEVLDGVRAGQELGDRGDRHAVLRPRPRGRRRRPARRRAAPQAAGDTVTFVRTRNINYTNLCTFKCRFCAFAKGPLSLNLRGKPYLLTHEEIAGRAREAWEAGATEVCLQGGIHPTFDGDYYSRLRGGQGRGAGDPRPRLHRAGGHRRRAPPAASRSRTTCAG